MPGIAGLLEGIRFVRRQGVESIAARERQVALRAARGLESLPGVRVFWDRELQHQTGVVSFVTEGRDCEAVGEALAGGASPRAGLTRARPIARRGPWTPAPCGSARPFSIRRTRRTAWCGPCPGCFVKM